MEASVRDGRVGLGLPLASSSEDAASDGRAVESWRPPKTRCARWWLPLFWLDCWRLASWVACTEVGCRPNTGDGQQVQVIFGMDSGEQTKAHIFKLLEYFAS